MIHIKQIIPMLILSALASCDQQSDITNSDKFPGFVQIGRDQETSRLFVDLESVKRSNDGTVSFKLLRVIDSGYAIQDAITNCRDNFQGLTGTKFTKDGVSESEYPGNANLLPYKNNPALTAMISKVCDKADESRIITGPFDDIKALEMVYGPYHPEIKAAYWTGMNPPTTLSQSASYFTGKDGFVKIVLSQENREGNETKRILLTQTNLAEGDNDCHACGVLLGAITFIQVGDKWRIESENRYLDVSGANGEPPELAWVNIGKNTHVITEKMTDIHQGVTSGFIGIYKLGTSSWLPLLELNEEAESLSDVRLAFSNANPENAYAEARITIENESDGSKTAKEKKFIFNGSQYQLQSPDESMMQTDPNIQTPSLTQAAKVADSIQSTSSESSPHSLGKPNGQGTTIMPDGSSYVEKMLEASMDNDEGSIQANKQFLESQPKPPKGDKKAARKANDEALVLIKAQEFEQAVPLLAKANQLDPSDIEVLNNYGSMLMRTRNLDNAYVTLVNALAMKPDRASAWRNLADVLGLQGKVDLAVAGYMNAYRFSKNREKLHQSFQNKQFEDNPYVREAVKKATEKAVVMYFSHSPADSTAIKQ